MCSHNKLFWKNVSPCFTREGKALFQIKIQIQKKKKKKKKSIGFTFKCQCSLDYINKFACQSQKSNAEWFRVLIWNLMLASATLPSKNFHLFSILFLWINEMSIVISRLEQWTNWYWTGNVIKIILSLVTVNLFL